MLLADEVSEEMSELADEVTDEPTEDCEERLEETLLGELEPVVVDWDKAGTAAAARARRMALVSCILAVGSGWL